MSATKELNHLLSAKVSFERVLSRRACTTRPASWSVPTAKGVGEGGHTWAWRGKSESGGNVCFAAWKACSVSQDKHTKNMHRASEITGFDTFTI